MPKPHERGGCPLAVQHVGLPQRAIRRKLTGAAIDEGAASHHQITGIARHWRRHWIHVPANGGAGLERTAHLLEGLGGTETHRLNHIAARRTSQGLNIQTTVGKHLGHQIRTDQGLGHHLRRQKQTLKEQAIEIEATAPLRTDPRRGEAAAGLLHQLSATSHIATAGGDGAAEILDQ